MIWLPHCSWQNLPKNAFTVRINDRGILKGMALYCGFPRMAGPGIHYLDKMDKIGLDGVKAELLELGYAAESVEKYAELLSGLARTPQQSVVLARP